MWSLSTQQTLWGKEEERKGWEGNEQNTFTLLMQVLIHWWLLSQRSTLWLFHGCALEGSWRLVTGTLTLPFWHDELYGWPHSNSPVYSPPHVTHVTLTSTLSHLNMVWLSHPLRLQEKHTYTHKHLCSAKFQRVDHSHCCFLPLPSSDVSDSFHSFRPFQARRNHSYACP